MTWSDSAGLPDVEGEETPTLDAQYAIGSITKTFTAVLLLQLRDLLAPDGTIPCLYWATCPFTRLPEIFGPNP